MPPKKEKTPEDTLMKIGKLIKSLEKQNKPKREMDADKKAALLDRLAAGRAAKKAKKEEA